MFALQGDLFHKGNQCCPAAFQADDMSRVIHQQPVHQQHSTYRFHKQMDEPVVSTSSAQPSTNPFVQYTPPYTPKPSPLRHTNPFYNDLAPDIAPNNAPRNQQMSLPEDQRSRTITSTANTFHMADCASGSFGTSHVEDAAVRDQKSCNSTLHQDPEPDSTHAITNSFEEAVNFTSRPNPDQQQAVADTDNVHADLDQIQSRDWQHQAVYNFFQINQFGNNSSLGLPLDETHEWVVSYEQICKIGEELDLNDGWKMLASKLKFDIAIDKVSQWSRNRGESSTELLLRVWMKSNEIRQCDDVFERLLNALTAMDRQDIIHRLEDLEA